MARDQVAVDDGVSQSWASMLKDSSDAYDVWQRHFWEHTIRDERDFESHVAYIHFNPVKHGYVERAADWPHSSIHRFIRDGLIPLDWATEGSSESDWGECR